MRLADATRNVPTLRVPNRRAAWGLAAACALLAASGCGDNHSSDPGDPLLANEWYIHNVGQDVFTGVAGTPGIDLNAWGAWNAGITGAGVKVMVVDSGVEIAHPDLKDRIDSAMLHNFDPTAANANDPTPPASTSSDEAHGTGVAGIIAATANNGIGGRGVAYDASLGAVRYLCSDGCRTPVNMLSTFGGAPFSQATDVFNASYGDNFVWPEPFDIEDDFEAIVLQHLETMRNGRGALIIQAAGNEFSRQRDAPASLCSNANAHNVTCYNSSNDPQLTMPQVVGVAALNAMGVRASYSSGGANILVSGLGGEFGFAQNTFDIPAGPALISTDLTGCSQGMASTGGVNILSNPFNVPGSAINAQFNANCDYMANMSGTSAAAPTVAGVIALMLQANPQLTWRDVRTILMKTARRIDASREPTSVELPSGEQYVPEPAWTRNAAGYWFDNWYGFGLVDAAAAVTLARGYGPHLSGSMLASTASVELSEDGSGEPVPQANATGLEVDLNVSGVVQTIEHVQVSIDMVSANPGDLGIELISPSGTRSVLQNAYNGYLTTAAPVTDWVLASSAFNGESPQGTWKLRFIDVDTREGEPMLAQSVKFAALGH
jgi:subtilisin family serine protease